MVQRVTYHWLGRNLILRLEGIFRWIISNHTVSYVERDTRSQSWDLSLFFGETYTIPVLLWTVKMSKNGIFLIHGKIPPLFDVLKNIRRTFLKTQLYHSNFKKFGNEYSILKLRKTSFYSYVWKHCLRISSVITDQNYHSQLKRDV